MPVEASVSPGDPCSPMVRLRKQRSQRSSLPSRSGLQAPQGWRQPPLSPEARGPGPSDPKHRGFPWASPAGRATAEESGNTHERLYLRDSPQDTQPYKGTDLAGHQRGLGCPNQGRSRRKGREGVFEAAHGARGPRLPFGARDVRSYYARPTRSPAQTASSNVQRASTGCSVYRTRHGSFTS